MVVYLVVIWSYDHTVELKSNKVFSFYSLKYTAPTALGIRQEVKQITANVFLFSVFNVLSSCYVFTFVAYLMFSFYFFSGTFLRAKAATAFSAS